MDGSDISVLVGLGIFFLMFVLVSIYRCGDEIRYRCFASGYFGSRSGGYNALSMHPPPYNVDAI